jgi:hypothetical protein
MGWHFIFIAIPNAEAGISIFAVSSYDTEYALVKEEKLDKVTNVFALTGHNIE